MADKVRTWIYWHCWTKVTLKKGKEFYVELTEPTEEGWNHEEMSLYFDGEFIHRKYVSGGVDCDGRIERHKYSVCHYLNYQDRGDDWGRVQYCYNYHGYLYGKIHNWKEVISRQRDYSAEAMGY